VNLQPHPSDCDESKLRCARSSAAPARPSPGHCWPAIHLVAEGITSIAPCAIGLMAERCGTVASTTLNHAAIAAAAAALAHRRRQHGLPRHPSTAGVARPAAIARRCR